MSLTRFQIHERLSSLKGELKAAKELDRINADTLAAKEKEVSLARQAKEKSETSITRLEEEARSLATQYASSVDDMLSDDQEAQPSEGHTLNAFANPIYENGEARLNSVFEEATHP